MDYTEDQVYTRFIVLMFATFTKEEMADAVDTQTKAICNQEAKDVEPS